MIRVLDPTTAVRRGDAAPEPTVYVSDLLMTRPGQAEAATTRIREVLADLGWRVEPVGKPRERRRYDLRIQLRSTRPVVLRLSSEPTLAHTPPDAWIALQRIADADEELAKTVELVHVLAATSMTGIGGYWSGIGGYWSGIGGYWSGIGGYWSGISNSPLPSEFGVPGFGGKVPVAVVVDDPSRRAPVLKRPPVVVMPDTGIGRHPWFPREQTPAAFPGQSRPVKIVDPPSADDNAGVSTPLTGELDRLAGHGTFIAGIIRQTSPAAVLEARPVLSSAGVMMEDVLLDLLHDLLERQLQALERRDPAQIIDVLTLSVGYYHEDPDDAITDSQFAAVLRDLGAAGVLVVAGAGNDATDRPMLPAGFAGQFTGFDSRALPLVSVGSLNPNGTTVSLFSNAGAWVSTYRSGAAIVSTLPQSQDAAAQASVIAGSGTPDYRDRSTIDRDDFSGGFGVWSGTSFAAPVLAGQLAQALVEFDPVDVSLDAMLDRGWKAIGKVVDNRSFERP